MNEAYTVVAVTDEFAIATWHNVIVCVLRPGLPEAFVVTRPALERMAERYGNEILSLTILDGNFTSLFSAQSRQIAREQLGYTRGVTRRMAIAVLTEGLLASATRTTMNALSALLELEFEWKTFDAIAPACAYLAPCVIPAADPRELAEIARRTHTLPVEQSRRTLR